MSSRSATESQIEYLAWFRFPVTWTYISGPATEFASKVAPKPLPQPALTLAPIVPAPSPSRNPAGLDAAGSEDSIRPTGSNARWEMMVPKMARPPARPVTNLGAVAAPALAAPPPINAPAAPVKAIPATVSLPSLFAAPSFSLHTPEDQVLAR